MLNLKTPLAYELANLLYNKLLERGELVYDDLFKIIDSNSQYGLRRVSSGAICILREKQDVEQTKDKKGFIMFKLLK
jgi:hypothetical protein